MHSAARSGTTCRSRATSRPSGGRSDCSCRTSTKARRFPTVEALASIYVDALQREVAGPYVIAGYSSGATIGFEMARQLQARGAAVELLVALDGGLPNRGPAPGGWRKIARATANLWHWTRYDLLVTSPVEMASRVWTRLSQRTNGGLSFRIRDERGVAVSAPPAPPTTSPPSTRIGRAGTTVASWSSRRAPDRCVGPFDPDLGWTRMVAGAVSVVPVPGSHETFLREPYVRTVAEEIRRELRKHVK